MRCVNVCLPAHGGDREYDILIARGLLDKAGELARPVLRADRILLVSDDAVAPLYGNRVARSLEAAGFAVSLLTLAAGERSKSLATLEQIYEAALAFSLHRNDAIVALGGGVVGDVAGFAAATLLRGVDCVQIPTTLLAQVDSSVGGKVAVNLSRGKNLAGAFHQPRLVLIDPDCLDSLPDRTFADGMAEVIKYGASLSLPLLERLEQAGSRDALRPHIDNIIRECCDLKRALVVEDEHDTGRRMLLNFGHTLGHAYEAAYHYERYTHGEAVAAGMCLAARLGELWGHSAPGTADRLSALVRRFGLPEAIACTDEAYAQALDTDKKGESGALTVILLTLPGNAFMQRVERSAVRESIQRLRKTAVPSSGAQTAA